MKKLHKYTFLRWLWWCNPFFATFITLASRSFLTRAPLGVLDFHALHAGGDVWTPPSNSASGPCSDTGKAAFERAPKISKKSLQSLFWSGQRSGHKRSLKTKIRRFVGQMSTIFNKSTHSSKTNKATALRKSSFDSPINALIILSDLTYLQRFCLQGATTAKIVDFFLKPFVCNNFWLKPCTNFILPASCFSRQDASHELSFALERSCWKFDLRSRSWPDPKRSCCISVDPHRRPEHSYGVFIALSGLYQKLFPKNCWWPSMTWNDLGDMTRGHQSQYSDSGCQLYL